MNDESRLLLAVTIIIISLIISIPTYCHLKNGMIRDAISSGANPIEVGCAFGEFGREESPTLCNQKHEDKLPTPPPTNIQVTCEPSGKKKLDFIPLEPKDIPFINDPTELYIHPK